MSFTTKRPPARTSNISRIDQTGRTDLDSHADTCVLGGTFHIYENTAQQCTVYPYSTSYKPKVVTIAHGGTAYDHSDGHTYILDVNNGFNMITDLSTSLLNPNQMRANGIAVDDTPVHLSHDGLSTHSIFIPDLNLRLPLQLDGIISFLPTRIPTAGELESCVHVTLTSPVDWDPYSEDFNKQEEQAIKQQQGFISAVESHPIDVYSESDNVLSCVSRALSQDAFLQLIPSTISSLHSKTRRPKQSAESLAQRWGISLEAAERTLLATTQKFIRTAQLPIHRRYRTQQQQFRYNRLNTRFYSDTMFVSTKSIRGYTCGQVFVNDTGFSRVYPMKSKSMAGTALSTLFSDVGVPTSLHTDGAKEMTLGHWKEIRDKHGGIKQTIVEPHSPWQNRAEAEIRELKKQVTRIMHRSGAHKRLWDFCLEYVSELRSRTALGLPKLNGRTPHELVTGDTPDISEWTEFSFYQPVYYYHSSEFPEPRGVLGRWLGVSHRVGQALCYWILPESGEPISRTTVQSIPDDEFSTQRLTDNLQKFDSAVSDRLDRGTNDILDTVCLPTRHLDVVDPGFESFDADFLHPEAEDFDAEAFDNYISAQVLLPKGDSLVSGQVIKRKRDSNGNPIGHSNNNPLLDTRVYEVQFPDGTEQEYTANLIAESLYSQVDDEGNQFILLDEILDHKSDSTAITIENMYVEGSDGANPHLKRTTKGWKLLVLWKDGTTTWVPLKDLKESNPVQVAEYAIGNKIASEPAFNWWVHDVIRRKDRILSKIKSKYWKRTHKFGIQVPKSVKEALDIDKETGTDLWRKAIEKEMTNTQSAFRILNENEKVPVGYQFIKCHMIFDVKMDFTRKARFVAGGHMTETPASLTYSSVVSRESVRIAFLLAALNDLEVLSADIGNAYLNADCREKVYLTAGPEFGSHAGKNVLIVRALYGLKSSGAAWRAHLAQSMIDIGFKPCVADPDVWMRAAAKNNGDKYYEYVLIYVDDILACSTNPQKIMETLSGVYRFKEDPKTKAKYGPPDRYLGANIGTYQLPDSRDGKHHWYMSADDYVTSSVKNVEQELAKSGKKLPTKVECPMSPAYRPELDVSPLLSPELMNYYQNLIGVLRWAVELGRIDIHVSVSLLSQYLAQPREGHLDQAFRIFGWLKKHSRSRVVFDDAYIGWENKFTEVDWSDFYPDAVEPIPSNAPEARGPEVQVNCFVDADHAGNRVTRRSHTGVLIFCNKAPILWYSKRQNTVETSTFGSEFIALKIATELIQALRYKLRMMGVALDGPANVFCDNNSVVINSSIPESTLKKKHVSICYHRTREACAMKMIRIAHEGTTTNLADCLTKNLPGPTLLGLLHRILY
jgi:Reverse transcriptase (RNA-dependent DNA polymerase)